MRCEKGGDDPEEWQKLMKRRAREAELARKAAFEAKAAMAMVSVLAVLFERVARLLMCPFSWFGNKLPRNERWKLQK